MKRRIRKKSRQSWDTPLIWKTLSAVRDDLHLEIHWRYHERKWIPVDATITMDSGSYKQPKKEEQELTKQGWKCSWVMNSDRV